MSYKKISIVDKQQWKEFILSEANYQVPEECRGGICVDAGCNIGDFPLKNGDRFDSYICFDVFQENVEECIKNTQEAGIKNVEVHKFAVWDKSDEDVSVMAFQPPNYASLNSFGNNGNIGCLPRRGDRDELGGHFIENTIDVVKSISLETIVEQYAKKQINLLKIDVEGSEYKFLLNKDLSGINYIVGEFHYDDADKKVLEDWISRTHYKIEGYYKLKTL